MLLYFFFFFNDQAPTEIHTYLHTLSLHDALPISARQVADHLPDGAAVILRSTVRIGTTRDVVKPVLDKSGRNYRLAMCPERTLEGDALRELAVLPQIIGGLTAEGADAAAALFSRLTSTVVREIGRAHV